jgi:hypothetical protein
VPGGIGFVGANAAAAVPREPFACFPPGRKMVPPVKLIRALDPIRVQTKLVPDELAVPAGVRDRRPEAENVPLALPFNGSLNVHVSLYFAAAPRKLEFAAATL